MAYAALISLEHTLNGRLMNSPLTSLTNSSAEIIGSVYSEVISLRKVVKELDSSGSNINRKRIHVLDGQIRQASHEFEHVLESYVSTRFHSQYPVDEEDEEEEEETRSSFLFTLDLEELKQEIDSFTQNMNTMKSAYVRELRNSLPEEEEDDDDDDDESSEMMIGLTDQINDIKQQLPKNLSPFKGMTVVSLLGMCGIGKTSLARKTFQDPLVSIHFDRRVFVTIGPKYRLKRVLLDVAKQLIDPGDHETMLFNEKGGELLEDGLRGMIYKSLKDRRYFIVLDDVWDKRLWYKLAPSFPDNNNRSQVLMTTRLKPVAEATPSRKYEVRFLDKEESWALFRDKVFAPGEECSRELEEAGKKIAENCEGLPLTIQKVANILSKAKKTVDYWNIVALDKQNSVFRDAYDQMYKKLYRSYEYLDQDLKACFLYMGVFPNTYEIPRSKLIDMWSAEEFCERDSSLRNLHQLQSRSLVMVHKTSYAKGIKTCRLYSPFWYMCNKEANKDKFFHGLNSVDDASEEEDLKNQRRLCIRNNTLFGIRDVYDSMESIATVRSLLCTGPYHQYPVPICLGLRLLRILDALNIRQYEFPTHVVHLLQLMYLSLTFEGNIPPSISKLWNLRYLIVCRHMTIVEPDGKSSPDLPTEIWDMQKLNHLQVMGSDLPHPPCEGSLLPNLLTLSDVSPQSCTKDVLERIPKLKKLGIRIELAPDANEPLSCFDHISYLRELEILKCVIVCPKIESEVVDVPLTTLSIFPPSLEKLTLSGSFGYPWKELSKISSLPKLKELKLQCYAFQGPKWEVHRDEFPALEFLFIEDIDLVQWKLKDYKYCFKNLERISVKHCYKLENMPSKFGRNLRKIELVYCNPLAETCAKKLKRDREMNVFNHRLLLDIHSLQDV